MTTPMTDARRVELLAMTSLGRCCLDRPAAPVNLSADDQPANSAVDSVAATTAAAMATDSSNPDGTQPAEAPAFSFDPAGRWLLASGLAVRLGSDGLIEFTESGSGPGQWLLLEGPDQSVPAFFGLDDRVCSGSQAVALGLHGLTASEATAALRRLT